MEKKLLKVCEASYASLQKEVERVFKVQEMMEYKRELNNMRLEVNHMDSFLTAHEQQLEYLIQLRDDTNLRVDIRDEMSDMIANLNHLRFHIEELNFWLRVKELYESTHEMSIFLPGYSETVEETMRKVYGLYEFLIEKKAVKDKGYILEMVRMQHNGDIKYEKAFAHALNEVKLVDYALELEMIAKGFIFGHEINRFNTILELDDLFMSARPAMVTPMHNALYEISNIVSKDLEKTNILYTIRNKCEALAWKADDYKQAGIELIDSIIEMGKNLYQHDQNVTVEDGVLKMQFLETLKKISAGCWGIQDELRRVIVKSALEGYQQPSLSRLMHVKRTTDDLLDGIRELANLAGFLTYIKVRLDYPDVECIELDALPYKEDRKLLDIDKCIKILNIRKKFFWMKPRTRRVGVQLVHSYEVKDKNPHLKSLGRITDILLPHVDTLKVRRALSEALFYFGYDLNMVFENMVVQGDIHPNDMNTYIYLLERYADLRDVDREDYEHLEQDPFRE